MNNNRCLYCYLPLDNGETDFHPSCSKKFFSVAVPPVLPYTENQIESLGLEVIRSRSAVTGVQAKLSLDIHGGENKSEPKRFTIVGLWGGYILKPERIEFWQGRLNRLHDRFCYTRQADNSWRLERLSP